MPAPHPPELRQRAVELARLRETGRRGGPEPADQRVLPAELDGPGRRR